MAIAETAELVATLKLKDQLSGPAKGAMRSVQGLERAAVSGSRGVARAESGMSRLGRSAGGMSRAFANAKRNIGGLLSGPLGILGLGAGLFGLGSLLTNAIGKAQDFAGTTAKLSKIIGLNASDTSALVDVLDKFGISGEQSITLFARLEKNAGTFATAQDKARAALVKSNKAFADGVNVKKLSAKDHAALAKFQNAYGFSVRDSNGHIADANELLARSRDFFNSNATATQKATALQKLYGKSWKDLIPLFSLSREEFEKQFKTAMRLTPQQLKDAAAMRGAQREFNDTLGDTQTMIGLALLPALTKLLRVANSFVSNNQQGIVAFFRDGADAAMKIGGAINSTVIPAIKAIAGAWNALPEPVRNILIGGFVANKLTGKIFGTSLVGIAKPLLGAVLGKGGLFGRGNSPASPLYVKAVGAGGLGGPGAGAPGAAGGRGKIGTAFGILGIGAEIAGVIATQQQISQESTRQAGDIQRTQAAWLKRQPTVASLKAGRDAIEQGIRDIRSNPLNVLVQGDALDKLEAMRKDINRQIAIAEKRPTTTSVKALAGHADERNKRTELTQPKITTAVSAGAAMANRNLPQRRDLNDTGFRIVNAVRAVGDGVTAAERTGFAIVVTTLWAIQAAIRGLPANFGSAGEMGRGTGPEGRASIPNPAGGRVGIEKNRGGGKSLNVFVSTSISARETTHATTVASRYGTNATQAGAR